MSFRVSATILLLVVFSALGFGIWWRQSHDVKASSQPANVQQTDQQTAPPPPSDREDYKNFDMPGEKKAGGKSGEQQDRGNEPPADAKQ